VKKSESEIWRRLKRSRAQWRLASEGGWRENESEEAYRKAAWRRETWLKMSGAAESKLEKMAADETAAPESH
jgi:hypothetical protein